MPRYVPEDLTSIYKELIADNDRATAIVGGAVLDSFLAIAISRRLMPLEEADENKLFSEAGPFGTCSQKIQAAFALGLCGPKARRDFELLNRIRNVFAHNMNTVSFNDPEIASRCGEVYAGSRTDLHKDAKWKEKFVLAVQMLGEQLFWNLQADGIKLKPARIDPRYKNLAYIRRKIPTTHSLSMSTTMMRVPEA